jgi:hypothetical protein
MKLHYRCYGKALPLSYVKPLWCKTIYYIVYLKMAIRVESLIRKFWVASHFMQVSILIF